LGEALIIPRAGDRLEEDFGWSFDLISLFCLNNSNNTISPFYIMVHLVEQKQVPETESRREFRSQSRVT